MKTIFLILFCAMSAQAEVVRSVGSLIYKDNVNSRVGINTLSPAYTLDVDGIGNFSGGIIGSVTGASSLNVLKAGDTMTGQLTTASTLTVQGSAFSVGGSTLVVANGLTGICATPYAGYPLSVGLFGVNNPSVQLAGSIYFNSTAKRILTMNSAGNYGTIGNDSAGTFSLGWSASNINISGTPVLTWTDGDKVGIGTTAPVGRLSVVEGSNVSSDLYTLKVSSANSSLLFGVHGNGHLSVDGSRSTFTVCENASLTSDVDTALQITFSGANSSCGIAFGHLFDATPICVPSGTLTDITEAPRFTVKTTAGLTVTPATGAWGAGDIVDIICLGAY
jgi:hypothetical protein